MHLEDGYAWNQLELGGGRERALALITEWLELKWLQHRQNLLFAYVQASILKQHLPLDHLLIYMKTSNLL